MRHPKLSEEDQQRVERYLNSNPLHANQRAPFKLGRLLIVLVLIVALLSAFSILLGKYYFYG